MIYNDRSWAEVNLDAIKSNVLNIKSILNDDTKIMAVVKADGYGHGSLETANILIENGVEYLGVACVDEAIYLRKHGIDVPILVLGYTSHARYKEVIENNITQTIFDIDSAKVLSNVAIELGKKAKIHVKIDTGMGRIGYFYGITKELNKKTIDEIKDINSLEGLEIEGIFTHFSVADENDDDFTKLQFKRFMEVVSVLKNKGIRFKYRHCCNSAATIKFPEMHLDMVRPGIIIYGVLPSPDVKPSFEVKPAMQFKTRVVSIKDVKKGTPISYGKTYETKDETTVATIPVGYADGLPRVLSNTGSAVVGGKIVPILGRICMDQCIIDVTSVNNINVGDEVVMFGIQGSSFISVESIADISGTINYEILCSVGKRIPRVYLKDGNVKKVMNFLN